MLVAIPEACDKDFLVNVNTTTFVVNSLHDYAPLGKFTARLPFLVILLYVLYAVYGGTDGGTNKGSQGSVYFARSWLQRKTDLYR
jgi:hypothetical protein